MRSAEARVGLMDAVDEACGGLRGCAAALSVPGKVLRFVLLAGAGAAGVALLRRAFRSRPAVVSAPTPAVSGGGAGRYLLMQIMTLVLLPWVRQMLLQGRVGDAVRKLRPARSFFRWIGLDS